MKTEETFTNYISEMSERQIKEYIHTVGKAANQRLRELEKREMETASAAYRYIKSIARDEDYATSTTGKGELKFNLRVRGRSLDELRHMAATIDKFMEAKSSTTAGVKDIYKQARETFEKKYAGNGYSFTFNQFAEAMSMTIFRKFEALYGSGIALKIYNRAKTNGLSDYEIEKALEEAGLTESTDFKNKPTLSAIETKIDQFIVNKKDIGNNDNGLFDDGEDADKL